MTRTQFWLTTSMAALAIALVVVNAVLYTGIRSLQAEVSGRAQFVQQSQQLEVLFNEMVRALVGLSARSDDQQLRSLLQGVGITFTVDQPPPAPAAPKK